MKPEIRFARAAATYDRHTEVQRQAADLLLRLLPAEPLPERILEIGCGTGLLTALLAARFPVAHIAALDAAAPMLARARERLRQSPRINLIQADVTTFTPEGSFDLVVSNCVLHWVHPLEAVLTRLAGVLRPGGALVATLMSRGTLAELHAARLAVAPGKPPARAFPTVSGMRKALAAAKLGADQMEEHTFVRHRPSAREILRGLREQGLTGGDLSRGTALLTPGEIRKLLAHYERHFSGPAGVRASYNVLALRARRPG